jgi:hypothetical protein
VENNLLNWIKKQTFQYRKFNVRPWGAFDMAVSLDGTTWMNMPQSFGSAFDEPSALELVFIRCSELPESQKMIVQWVGVERSEEILRLIQASKESETQNVPEHIHNTENK